MILARYQQAPGETLDRDIDFTSWLVARGDTIDTFGIGATAGLTVLEAQVVNDTIVRVFIRGPIGQYIVVADIRTLGGRVKRGEIVVRVQGHEIDTFVEANEPGGDEFIDANDG